jgi:hypothetical protein
MNNSFKKFLILNLFTSFVLAALGWILFATVLSGFYLPVFHFLLLFALLINLLTFYILTRQKYSPARSPQIIFKSFGIKFFSYMFVTLVFFLVEKNTRIRINYILVLFCLYLPFTIIEITSLTKFFKAENINSN